MHTAVVHACMRERPPNDRPLEPSRFNLRASEALACTYDAMGVLGPADCPLCAGIVRVTHTYSNLPHRCVMGPIIDYISTKRAHLAPRFVLS